MRDDKSTEGLIPDGLVAGDLRGAVSGSLTIAGSVERSDLRAEKLIISETGHMTDGVAEAEVVTIEGRASGMVFRAGRLEAGASARIADCTIEMSNPTGCSIDEDAYFEGDIKIAVSQLGRSSSTSDNDQSETSYGAAENASSTGKNVSSGTKKGSGYSQGALASSGGNSEIDEAESNVEIPLGD